MGEIVQTSNHSASATAEEEEQLLHVLLISFPGQGHVKPLLRLAKRLASKGLLVTFSCTEDIGSMMRKAADISSAAARGSGEDEEEDEAPTPVGNGLLRFEFFSDGSAPDDPLRNDLDSMMDRLARNGPRAVADLLSRQARLGRPVACVINNPFLPWVLDVAADAGIPSAVLWVQSCAVFSVYYHYLHHHPTTYQYPTSYDTAATLRIQGMPPLSPADVPSFLLPDVNPYKCLTKVILDQFRNMEKASWVMVDSFRHLELPVIESLAEHVQLLTVGPLLKSIQDLDSTSIGGNMWRASSDSLTWLDSQPLGSVVYVSFGSVVVLSKQQMHQVARGIQSCEKPFLWVVKPPQDSTETGLPEGFEEETAGRGLVVPWCPQERVLSHPAVACFVTHCGWNSSMESLCSGVPVVAFPHWGDQPTNAKFFVDVYGVGLRLRAPEGQDVVPQEEVKRCILEVAGGGLKGEEFRRNAAKWKAAATEAVAEGGSSDLNIQAVVDGIRQKAASLKSVL